VSFYGLKACVILGMTRVFSPHRSGGIETYGFAIGYDETRLWRVALGFKYSGFQKQFNGVAVP
jgi:hypothetical protein